jgi:hypothetical protein
MDVATHFVEALDAHASAAGDDPDLRRRASSVAGPLRRKATQGRFVTCPRASPSAATSGHSPRGGCRAGTRTRRPPGPRNWAAVVMSAAARRPAPAVSQTACNPRCALWTAARLGPRVGPERVIWVAGRGPKLRGCPTGTWPISSGAGCSNWVPPRPRSPGAPVGSFRPRPSAAWRGQRSIRVGDRFARALAGALQVTEHRVRRAAGLPATEVPGEPTRPHLRLVRGGARAGQ